MFSFLKRRGKANWDYKFKAKGFKAKGNVFEITFTTEIDKKYLSEAVLLANKLVNEDIDLLDEFHADPRAYRFAVGLNDLIRQVENNVKKNIKGFKIIHAKLKDFLFRNEDGEDGEDGKTFVEIKVEGLFTRDYGDPEIQHKP